MIGDEGTLARRPLVGDMIGDKGTLDRRLPVSDDDLARYLGNVKSMFPPAGGTDGECRKTGVLGGDCLAEEDGCDN